MRQHLAGDAAVQQGLILGSGQDLFHGLIIQALAGHVGSLFVFLTQGIETAGLTFGLL